MLRKLITLVGLALCISFLFPIESWIKAPAQLELRVSLSNIFSFTPWGWTGMPMLLSLLIAIPPAFLLLSFEKVWQRLPQSTSWILLLGASSLLFISAQSDWANTLYGYVGHGLDFSRRMTIADVWSNIIGLIKASVVLSLVGVLLNLQPFESYESVEGDTA